MNETNLKSADNYTSEKDIITICNFNNCFFIYEKKIEKTMNLVLLTTSFLKNAILIFFSFLNVVWHFLHDSIGIRLVATCWRLLSSATKLHHKRNQMSSAAVCGLDSLCGSYRGFVCFYSTPNNNVTTRLWSPWSSFCLGFPILTVAC